MCWFCCWGVAKPVAEIYERASADLDAAGFDPFSALHFDFAHIVWEDSNFERHHVQWCLDHRDEFGTLSASAKAIVARSLEELLALPDEVLYPVPDGYQSGMGMDEADFPPRAGLEMVRF